MDPNGNPLANGQVGISTVPPELVREMLPEGLMQLATTLTIQAPGVARFAAPLQLTVPNGVRGRTRLAASVLFIRSMIPGTTGS